MPSDAEIAPQKPSDEPKVPRRPDETFVRAHKRWRGPTYYDRPQLKPAPFENAVVGSYVFVAGLSGATALLAALADLARGRAAARTVRHGRYLSLLAATIGPLLLIYDLHTPRRFYNMLRVAKRTSPMSIGTWILMTYSCFAFPIAGAQFLSDRVRWLRWLRGLARLGQVPAALAGMGLSTYTASLFSATSTPLWAAAPKALAVRFGSSSLASGAAALALCEGHGRSRKVLDAVAVAALTAELAATVQSRATYRRTGVDDALSSTWGRVEQAGGTEVGVVAPLVLYALSAVLGGRASGLSRAASYATLVGSLLFRIGFMGAGDVSAERPEISFRFSQPGNLP